MRTLITILLTFFLGLGAQAKYRANSQFNIRMADLSNYTVTFNNTTYFATEWVKIYNVPPGKHYLRIEESMQTRGYGMRANGRRLIYQGWITVPSASIVNSKVGFNRNFMLAGIIKTDRCGNGYGNAYGHDRPRAAYERGDYNGGWYPQQGPGQYPQGGYGQSGNNGQYNGQYDGEYDEDNYGYDGPNTYDYGNPTQGPDPNDGAYDDGTYGTSKLQAKPNTTAKPAVKNQAKSTK